MLPQHGPHDETNGKLHKDVHKSNTETQRQALLTQTADSSNYSFQTIKPRLSKYTSTLVHSAMATLLLVF